MPKFERGNNLCE